MPAPPGSPAPRPARGAPSRRKKSPSQPPNAPDRTPGLLLHPIGRIRTPFQDRYAAPSQPGLGPREDEGIIELEAGRNFQQALRDLKGFERIWIIAWLDRTRDWRPLVLPPRGPRTKRGVFATRAPHRPNPIGISVARLVGIEGLRLRVRPVDLLDQTPILDLKPYLPYADSFPDSAIGWLEALAGQRGGPGEAAYQLCWSSLAALQAAWLQEQFGIRLREQAELVLRLDPQPHPYRRIWAEGPADHYTMAIKSWRIRFVLAGHQVTVLALDSGYPPQALDGRHRQPLHDQEAHLAFHLRWPQEPATTQATTGPGE